MKYKRYRFAGWISKYNGRKTEKQVRRKTSIKDIRDKGENEKKQ